jgi:quinolinate synthase
MVTYCKNAPVKDIIVVTESGMLHRLRKECPDKNLIAGPTDRCACADCRYMKMNTLQKLRDCLDTLQPRKSTMEESLRKRAEAPLLRMLEQSK